MISWQIPAHELVILQKDGEPWRLGQGGLSLQDPCGAWPVEQGRSAHWQPQLLRARSAWNCSDLHNVAAAGVSSCVHIFQVHVRRLSTCFGQIFGSTHADLGRRVHIAPGDLGSAEGRHGAGLTSQCASVLSPGLPQALMELCCGGSGTGSRMLQSRSSAMCKTRSSMQVGARTGCSGLLMCRTSSSAMPGGSLLSSC